MENELMKIQEEIKDLQNRKRASVSNGVSDFEMDILEDELIELEYKFACISNSLNEMLQYQGSCSHVFIDDLIDLTPDESKEVRYCAHCMFIPIAEK
jgi:hypothetical protein